MRNSKLLFAAALVAVLSVAWSRSAQAQASRCWVSGVGDDANPCSRTAPGKTFAGAISKTAVGGEIDALDPGGFGALTITHSITIDGGPGVSSDLFAGTNGMTINVAATDTVTLRNLSFNGVGTGLNGVNIIGGGTIVIENCTIRGLTTAGINFSPTSSAKLFVKNTTIEVCAAEAILSHASTGWPVTVIDSRLVNCGIGVRADSNSRITLVRCTMTGDTTAVKSVGTAGASVVNLDGCMIVNNGTGIHSEGASSAVRISDVTLTNNTIGLEMVSSGEVRSYGNNKIIGNGVDGTPTAPVIPMK